MSDKYERKFIMSELKKMWSETGKELDDAFNTLGKTIVKSAKLGIKKLNDWANSDEAAVNVNKYNTEDKE